MLNKAIRTLYLRLAPVNCPLITRCPVSNMSQPSYAGLPPRLLPRRIGCAQGDLDDLRLSGRTLSNSALVFGTAPSHGCAGDGRFQVYIG